MTEGRAAVFLLFSQGEEMTMRACEVIEMASKVFVANGDEQYFFRARNREEAMAKALKLFDIELVDLK